MTSELTRKQLNNEVISLNVKYARVMQDNSILESRLRRLRKDLLTDRSIVRRLNKDLLHLIKDLVVESESEAQHLRLVFQTSLLLGRYHDKLNGDLEETGHNSAGARLNVSAPLV